MKIKNAAVSGMFYPDRPAQLQQMISDFFAESSVNLTQEKESCPRALIVPHAGLIYSGQVAANAYSRLKPYMDSIQRVVMLGPSHRVPLRTIAAMTAERWRTPLGDVTLDTDFTDQLLNTGLVSHNDTAHLQEHCLEVQLPFLQILGLDKAVVPLVVGHVDAQQVAAVINYIFEYPDTLLIISSDLSHFHSYEDARQIDAETDQHILNLNPDLKPEQACGCFAVNGLLLSAAETGLKPQLLSICNSGDTAADKQRVVGYASYVFS